jgi:predicted DNA-binding transcriptional regulator AlpA
MSTTYLTKRAVAETLGVHTATIERLVKAGKLPRPIKLSDARSGSVRFPAGETMDAIARMRAA